MDKKDLKPIKLNGQTDAMAPGLSRRSFFVAAGAAGVGTAASLIAPKSAEAQSTDWTQPGNNNHVIELQNATSFADGAVNIEYYGHCAFRINHNGCSTR